MVNWSAGFEELKNLQDTLPVKINDNGSIISRNEGLVFTKPVAILKSSSSPSSDFAEPLKNDIQGLWSAGMEKGFAPLDFEKCLDIKGAEIPFHRYQDYFEEGDLT